MSRLQREHAGLLRRKLAYETLYLPHDASTVVVEDHDALYHHAAEVIGLSEPVTYLEFGVAYGSSMKCMLREFTSSAAIFVGFDSFLGLPESWMMHDRGAFSQDGRSPAIDDKRVTFIKGWFQNTLHNSLGWLAPHLSRRVLIHFDSDLYSSTLFLLTSLWPHCSQYYFIMDDFMVDDIVALHDFSIAYPVEVDFIARLQGGLPHAALGRITRVPFVLK